MNPGQAFSVEKILRDLSLESFSKSRDGYNGPAPEVVLNSPVMLSVLECRAYVLESIAQYLACNPQIETELATQAGKLREHYIRYARNGATVDINAMVEASSDAEAKAVWIVTAVDDCLHIYKRVRKQVLELVSVPIPSQLEIANEQKERLDRWIAMIIEKFVIK